MNCRFLVTNLLLPKLEKAAERGEEARVLSCLAAGLGGTIDLDDLGCHDNKGLKAKADAGATYNDLMMLVSPYHPIFIYCRNSQFVIQKCHSLTSIPAS